MLLPPYFADKKTEAQERSKPTLKLSPGSIVSVINFNASQIGMTSKSFKKKKDSCVPIFVNDIPLSYIAAHILTLFT